MEYKGKLKDELNDRLFEAIFLTLGDKSQKNAESQEIQGIQRF